MPKTLVQLRLDNALTQEELAKKIGVTRETIATWENAHNRPRPLHIRLLVEVFGVTISDIYAALEASKEQPKK